MQQNVRATADDADRDSVIQKLLSDSLSDEERAHAYELMRASYHIAKQTNDDTEREEAIRTLRQGAAAGDGDIAVTAIGFLRSLEADPD